MTVRRSATSSKAKARVVTGSRKEVRRRQRAIQSHIASRGYLNDTRVALSGEVIDAETGIGEPSLVARDGDKRLAGIQAMQTLSRPNRCDPRKDQAFVVDIGNGPVEALASFGSCFESAEPAGATTPASSTSGDPSSTGHRSCMRWLLAAA